MRVKALEIRWHETKPIFSADFQPFPAESYMKHEHPMGRTEVKEAAASHEGKAWRLATAGGDNHVRVWLVTPSPAPVPSTSGQPGPSPAKGKAVGQQPTVEYLATLSRHTAVVNVVRFSPNGMVLASAGDDGNVILWALSDAPPTKGFGENDDALYARESWKIRRSVRATQQEIYDMSWSPDGQWLLVGSTDNTARIINANDGSTAKQITEHNNYVQGVAWDPLNKYIATQSCDRHMHVYGLDIRSHASGQSEISINLVGKNSKMDVQQSRRGSSTSERDASATPGPSGSKPSAEPEFKRPDQRRSMSQASDGGRSEASMTPSSSFKFSQDANDQPVASTSAQPFGNGSTDDSAMNPPPTPTAASSSRRSSVSGSQAGSPAQHPANLSGSGGARPARSARSPSPMPPLPAIRMPVSATSPNLAAKTTGLVDAQSGSPLPPSLDQAKTHSTWLYGGAEMSPFFRRLSWSTDGALLLTPAGIFEDPFAAAKAVANQSEAAEGKLSKKMKKQEKKDAFKDFGPKPTVYIYSRANVARPPVAHLPGHKSGSICIRFNPLLWELRGSQPTPGQPVSVNIAQDTEADVELDQIPAAPKSDSLPMKSAFDLPYRMVYAVATHESVYVYDTQQAGPICMFGNLHYAPFTDVAWTADGMSLALASQDGYCSVVAFEAGELGTPLLPDQQPVRPMPSAIPTSTRPPPSASSSTSSLPPTPSTSAPPKHPIEALSDNAQPDGAPKPKKRRVQLTTVALDQGTN